LAVAPSAGAKTFSSDGLTYVKSAHDILPSQNRTFGEACPRGTHVLGGGHFNTGSFGTVVPFHSHPYDGGDDGRAPDDGWKVDAGLSGSASAVKVTVYAICSELLPTYERRKTTVPPSPQQDLVVRCDRGNAVSGGSSGNGNAVEVTSSPNVSNPGWRLRFDNYILSDLTVTGYAVCLRRNVDYESASTIVQPQTQVQLDVECPAARRVVGGGMDSSGAEGEPIIASSLPTGFKTSARDGWTIWPENRSPATPFTASDWASCIRPPG
jgi:hypothetical protein